MQPFKEYPVPPRLPFVAGQSSHRSRPLTVDVYLPVTGSRAAYTFTGQTHWTVRDIKRTLQTALGVRSNLINFNVHGALYDNECQMWQCGAVGSRVAIFV